MTFNLAAPPDFRGLDPDKPIKIYTGNLPHWRQDGATYFVTCNLVDALSAPKKEQLKSLRREWENRNPSPKSEETWAEYARGVFRQVENWMDAGHGVCWFRKERYAGELHRSILHFHQQRYEIGCFVIMANHFHLVIRPFKECNLEREIGKIKSVTAKSINKQEQLTGAIWQQESYDRIVRDEEHLYRVVQYIGSNPQRSGIREQDWHRWVNPQWQEAGWDFQTLQ